MGAQMSKGHVMKKSMSFLYPMILSWVLLLSLTGCYRMPDEDEYSLVPTTNNPEITLERNDSVIPSMSY